MQCWGCTGLDGQVFHRLLTVGHCRRTFGCCHTRPGPKPPLHDRDPTLPTKAVRQACALQPGALDEKLADKIEQLESAIADEGDGAAYFDRTFITEGMRSLLNEAVSWLAGRSTQAVFHLKQAMGGGKTHLLIGLGLVARHPSLCAVHCAGVPGADGLPAARVAAFNGGNSPEHFFWGEIAGQLDFADSFARYWRKGPEAPDQKAWLELFALCAGPVLILLDELPLYFHDLDTRSMGKGTEADVATRAFSNMLSAAGLTANVCVVVSDLTATYDTGGALIAKALANAAAELGRQERSITPVDLAADEIYQILRKRLFASVPDSAEIGQIAAAFGRKLGEAAKAEMASRGAKAMADEIAATYPFHPRLKNIIALFKENAQFKQTRRLIELVSCLLRSVRERKSDDVYLIGPQHFDLSIPEVREKIAEISGMRDVIAKDLWDTNRSAHAQVIDATAGADHATLVGNLLLTASRSTAVNAVRGLTTAEMIECLVTPVHDAESFRAAFKELEKSA